MADDELRGSGTDEMPPSIFDGFAIGARTGRFTRSTEMLDMPREEAYAEVNDELFRLTGKRLPNPVTQDRLRVGGVRNETLGQNHPDNTERAWLEEIARVTSPTRLERGADGQMNPVDQRVQALIVRATPSAIARRADELFRAAADEGARYNEQFGLVGNLVSGFGDLGGNIAAGDPTAIAGMAAGSSPARTVLGTFAKEALTNWIGSAVGESATAYGAERLGQPYTFKDFLLNTSVGAAVGGTLGVGGRVLNDAATGNLGRARPDPLAPRESIIAAPPEDTVREVAASLRSTESNAAREAATEQAIAQRTSSIVPEEEAYRAIDEADSIVRDLGEEPEPPAVVRETSPEEAASAARVADEAPAPESGAKVQSTFRGVTRPITFERVTPGSVGFAPAEFQYKRANGAQGSTGTLAGVETFDPVSSGKVLVYERKSGERVIADGHQRLALAQRAEAAGQTVALDAYIYREKDGFTASDVRQIAAQKNLREGAGDPLDVASILREAPDLLDSSMPLGGAVMRTGRALSRLTDEALGAVRNGLVTPEQGAVIARVLGDHPELQMAAVKQFMDDPPRTEAEASFIAREMAALPAYHDAASQMGLFGDAPLISGARERGAILAAAQNALRDDKRAFAAANRFADDLEAAGNVLAKEENARRAGAAKALLDELMTLSTRAGPVADALRRITAAAIENKTSAKKAGQQFADEVLAMLEDRGLLGLKTDAPAVAVPSPDPAPIHDLLDFEVRAAEIVHAQDLDDAALDGAMAEAAVERAMRGEQPPEFADDALGLTPESDLANIDRALADMEALGEPVDPTVREAAAAFLASPDQALMDAARARLAPEFSKKATPDAPRTHTAATESDVEVDAPFQPLRFKDEAKLIDELKWVTVPELAAIARDFEVRSTGSRAEITAAILNDWRKAQPDPEPVAPPPPPPAAVVDDLTKRAIRYAGREDAKMRSDDAIADLVEAVRNMPNADAWLARQIEDSADERRTAVMRQVRDTLKSEPRFAEDKPGEFGRVWLDADGASTALAAFTDKWETFAVAADKLYLESNNLPVSITEPIQAINKLIEGMQEFAKVPERVRALIPEWRAVFHEAVKQDRPWFDEAWFFTSPEGEVVDDKWYDQFFEDMLDPNKTGTDLHAAMAYGEGIPHTSWEDVRGLLNTLAEPDEESPKVSPALSARAQALIDELPDEAGAGMFDAEEVMRAAQPEFARIRRNLDELWDEWQPTLGKSADEVDSETLGLLRATDGYLADAMTAFDGAGGENGLRSYSRPRGTRFADAPRGWESVGGIDTTPLATPAQLTTVLEKRFGKKVIASLMEKAKLTIVETGADLPIFRSGGKFARMSAEDAAGWVRSGVMKPVAFKGNDLPRTLKVGESPGLNSMIYMVEGNRGKIRVTMSDVSDAMTPIDVSMNYKGSQETGPAIGTARGTAGEAVEVFARTIAVIRYDAKVRGYSPLYSFAGADLHLTQLYARMLSMKGVMPEGYRAFLRSPDGTFYLLPDDVPPAQFGRSMQPMTKDTVFARDSSTVFGYHLDGQSYINAASVTPERVSAIVLHEVGVHAGMENMLGTETWNAILADVDRRANSTNFDDHDFRRALNEAMGRSSAANLNEETLAWGVTNYELLREGSGFKGLIDRLIASVRAWLWKEFPSLRERFDLTMADYHALALGALRREAMTPLVQAPTTADPLRTPIAQQQLDDATRLNEIADMLKDCAP